MNEKEGCLGLIMGVWVVLEWVIAAWWAYDFIRPKNFLGIIGFLIVWVLGRYIIKTISNILIFPIIALFFKD